MIFLRYIGSGSFMEVSGDLCDTKKSTSCRAIHKTIAKLYSIKDLLIRLPNVQELEIIESKFRNKRGFPGILGCVDGCQIETFVLKTDITETFRCRKGFFSLNTMVICGPDTSVFSIDPRWPGSAHDSTVFAHSDANRLLSHQMYNGYHLLGDSAYQLTDKMMTPYRNPKAGAESTYNYKHSATRMAIEKCFGQVKRRFPLLKNGLRFKDLAVSAKCIVSCFILHNLCIKLDDIIEEEDDNDANDNAEQANVQNDANEGIIKRNRIKELLRN